MNNLYKVINNLGLGKAYNYVMTNNQGNKNPYHNNFHLESVANTALEGCLYYSKCNTDIFKLPILDTEAIQLVLLAALFHDFNHTGSGKDDRLNISIAKDGFYNFLLTEPDMIETWKVHIIYDLIDATCYPYTIENKDLNLLQKIIRDADILQGMLCQNYIHGVVGALAQEMNLPFKTMIEGQESFLRNSIFATDWANDLKAKILPDVVEKVNIIKSFNI